MISERKEIQDLIDDARTAGARQSQACKIIGISAKTYQRWAKPDPASDGRLETGREPPPTLKMPCTLITQTLASLSRQL